MVLQWKKVLRCPLSWFSIRCFFFSKSSDERASKGLPRSLYLKQWSSGYLIQTAQSGTALYCGKGKMQAKRVCSLLFQARESLPIWEMQLASGWVVITRRCSIWNGWNLSSSRTDLLHRVQVSHLQTNCSFAHLLSGGDLDSRLAPNLLGEPARGLWDVKDYPSVNASMTVCNTSKLSENLWLLVRNLSLWISSLAWDGFFFQPIYLLLKKISSGSITENTKRVFPSLNGHVTNSYGRKVSVFSLSHFQSSCCFNPCGTEQLSERACVLLQLHPQWQLKIIREGDN